MAAAALDAGAVLVNDVTAGRGDPDLLPLVAERGAAVCLVHMRGIPARCRPTPGTVTWWRRSATTWQERMGAAEEAGVPRGRVILDPASASGKTLGHNLALLAGVPAFAALGRPCWWGRRARGCIGALIGREVPERMAGSLGAGLAAVARGAAVLRVHDVRETADAPDGVARGGGRGGVMADDELTVRIRGLEAYGRHGVHAPEQELGQRFVVDLDIAPLGRPLGRHRRPGPHR